MMVFAITDIWIGMSPSEYRTRRAQRGFERKTCSRCQSAGPQRQNGILRVEYGRSAGGRDDERNGVTRLTLLRVMPEMEQIFGPRMSMESKDVLGSFRWHENKVA